MDVFIKTKGLFVYPSFSIPGPPSEKGGAAFFQYKFIVHTFILPSQRNIKGLFYWLLTRGLFSAGKTNFSNFLQTALQNPEGKEMCTHPFLGSRWALGVALIKSLSARHMLFSLAGPLPSLLLLCSAGCWKNSSWTSLAWKRRCESFLRRKEMNCHTWSQHPLPIPRLSLQGRGEGIWKQGDMLSLSEWERWESSFSFCLLLLAFQTYLNW